MKTAHKPDRSKLTSKVNDWRQMERETVLCDGDQLLVAVPIVGTHHTGWYYEYSVIVVKCDSEYFGCELSTGDDWGRDISEVDFFIVLG
jgi:hypothetical protein